MNAISAFLRDVDGEKAMTEIEGLPVDVIHDLRSGPYQSVNLEALKRKYENFQNLGRRIAPRFSLTMSAIVFNSRQSFRTESINISASGVLLKDLLPSSFMKSPIEILFIYEDRDRGEKFHLLFKGEAVGGPLRSQRVQFKSSANQASQLLENLCLDLTPIAV